MVRLRFNPEGVIAVWLVLIELTRPDGKPVWVAPSQVISAEAYTDENIGAHTLLRTTSGDRYLKDDPKTVIKKLRDEK